MTMLLIVRGIPGSGKTTYAKKWADENNAVHVEADMYFVDAHGVYSWKPNEIGVAHDWCQLKVAKALENGDNVVVSNTFVKAWEIEPYLKMVQAFYSCGFEIVRCCGTWQNVHNVPEAVLARMKASFEPVWGEHFLPEFPEGE